MVVFNHTQGFAGMCAPFLYIEGCTPRAREALMNDSRFWLPVNSLAFIALVAAFIYRSKRVVEPFNTLRLAMILFGLGVPLYGTMMRAGELHIVYDALRVSDYNQHGVPPHIMSFLWVYGWVGDVTGMLLMVVTWVSFSSKNLLARPALTGNPALFWSIEVPYLTFSLIFSVMAGHNYWWYFICMRICVASWSAFFLVLALFAAYYGGVTISRLKEGGDTFTYRQQLRVLIVVVGTLTVCGICLGVQGFFLDTIDYFYQIFLLCTSFYRVAGFSLTAGSALYVFVATSHYIEVSNTAGTGTNSTRKQSDTANSTAQNSVQSKSLVSTSSSEEDDTETGSSKDDAIAGENKV